MFNKCQLLWSAKQWPSKLTSLHAQTCECVTWQKGVKGTEASKVANQLTLRWKDDPGLSGWAEERTREMAFREGLHPLVTGFEDGGRWLGAKDCKWTLEAAKGKETLSPRATSSNAALPTS